MLWDFFMILFCGKIRLGFGGLKFLNYNFDF